jgi:hypothetical protein
MWLLIDLLSEATFAEKEVRVKQYVRNGRIVRGYNAARDIRDEPQEREQPKQKEHRPNPMEGSLGVPLALVGIAGIAGIAALAGNKGVIKAVEEKVKVEKAVASVAKSPVLERTKELPASKLTQELLDLRSLYQSDKSAAMTSFYAGIDKSKPQEAKLKFAQMVSQKEISIEEAGKLIESYDKATSGGLAQGTFKQNVVKKVETLQQKYDRELASINDQLEKYTDPYFKGRIPSQDRFDYLNNSKAKLELEQKLVVYTTYGEEFARLGSGKTQMEQKQYLFLQEYLADDPKQYKEFKNYILGGSLIQANKGNAVGFSAATPEEAVRNAFEYGYTSEDIAQFNTIFGMSLSKKEFKGIKNIYKKPKST